MLISGKTVASMTFRFLVVYALLCVFVVGTNAAPTKKIAPAADTPNDILVQYSQNKTGPWQDTNANTTVYVWQGRNLYFQAIDTKDNSKQPYTNSSVVWRQGHGGNAVTLSNTDNSNPNPGNPYNVTFNTASSSSTDTTQDVTAVINNSSTLYKAVHMVVVTGGMAIQKTDPSNPGQLTPQQDQNPGGYVPVNDDNDSYTFASNDPSQNVQYTTQIADKDIDLTKLTQGIPTEKDLVPLILNPIVPAVPKTHYQLVWNIPNIKIWTNSIKMSPDPASTNPDHSALVISGQTQFDASQKNIVYIEGITQSQTARDTPVSLTWIDASKIPLTYNDTDKAYFTIYTVSGADNVPCYGTYTYTSTVPGSAVGGTWNGGQKLITPASPGTTATTAQIKFGAGPDQEDVIFEPATPTGDPSHFQCIRQVNVVSITVTASSLTPSKMTTWVAPPYTIYSNSDDKSQSNNYGEAVVSHLTVGAIKGPTVKGPVTDKNGVTTIENHMRGVRFMAMGFIQIGKVDNGISATTSPFSIFVNNGTQIVEKIVEEQEYDSSVDAKLHLDTIVDGTQPWYDLGHYTGDQMGEPTSAGYSTNFFGNASQDQEFDNVNFAASDCPYHYIPSQFTVENINYSIVKNEYKLDFTDYFAVQTTQSINEADQVYTNLATATWSFDGSGTVLANDWTATGGTTAPSAKYTTVSGPGVPFPQGFNGSTMNDIDKSVWASQQVPATP